MQLFGAQYAMRVWLDGNLLKIQPDAGGRHQCAAGPERSDRRGQLGGTPALKGQQLNASIIAQTRPKDPQEFGVVTLRSMPMVLSSI